MINLNRSYLDCFSQCLVVIDRIAIGLNGDFLLHSRFYDAITFGFVLEK